MMLDDVGEFAESYGRVSAVSGAATASPLPATPSPGQASLGATGRSRSSGTVTMRLDENFGQEDNSPQMLNRRRSTLADAVMVGELAGGVLDTSLLGTHGLHSKRSRSKELESNKEVRKAFPMLMSMERGIDDPLLQEVYRVLRGYAAFDTIDIAKWATLPETRGIFYLGRHAFTTVGGMLFVDDEFILDEMAAVQTKNKVMRCRISATELTKSFRRKSTSTSAAGGKESPDVSDERNPAVEGGGSGVNSPPTGLEARKSSAMMTPLRSPTDSTDAESGVHRVYINVVEYEAVGSEWVVQTFQQTGGMNSAPFGNVFARAFLPFDWHNVVMNQSGVGKGEATRMPIPGEEKLRIIKPWLYRWCIQKDPNELASAVERVVQTIQYYKQTWLVLRTIKILMKSIRIAQKFTRKVLGAKRKALSAMMLEWEQIEAQRHRELAAYAPQADDTVDVAVHKTLLDVHHCSEPERARRIRRAWDKNKKLFVSSMRMATMALRKHSYFAWQLNVRELYDEWLADVVKDLSQSSSAIFNKSEVQTMMTQIAPEFELSIQAKRQLIAMETTAPKTPRKPRVPLGPQRHASSLQREALRARRVEALLQDAPVSPQRNGRSTSPSSTRPSPGSHSKSSVLH